MKKIISLLVFIPYFINAQTSSICQCNIDYGLQPYHRTSTEMDFSNEPPLVMKIFFQLNEMTAINYGFDEDDYLETVAFLNINYNQYNIFFKYIGYEFVDAEFLFDFADYYQPDRINFIILDTPDTGGGAGIPNPLNAAVNFKSITNELDLRFNILHEIGHLFGLKHTNEGTGSDEDIFDIPLNCNGNEIQIGNFPLYTANSENVTRDQSDTENYNAHVAGDFVTDTAATYFEPNYCIDDSTGTPIHIFSEEIVDAVGEPFVNVSSDNIMISLTGDRVELHPFITAFTDGQAIRMRETISNAAVLQPAITSVSSLYEPYTGNYYLAGPTDSNDKPLFQPGFDYRFVSAGGQTNSGYQIYNSPSDYDDISFTYNSNIILNQVDKFSLNLEAITHPNRSAIIIEQLDNEQPRICYHNVNRGASGGKIIKFNDGIPNGNYTSISKDSIQINQPTLIQDLENSLYLR